MLWPDTRKYYVKKHYLTLQVKGQGPTKVILGMQHSTLWTCTHIPKIIDPSRKKPLFDTRGQRTRSHEGHYSTWHTALWFYNHIPNIIDLSQERTVIRKYYLKNNYLTLRSKVKVPRMSLRYMTHGLMVMHPHITYHWPISKDKNVMVQTSFAEKKQKKIRLKQYISPFVRRGDIIKIHI